MVYNNHNNLYPMAYQTYQPIMQQPNMMYSQQVMPQQTNNQMQQAYQNNMQNMQSVQNVQPQNYQMNNQGYSQNNNTYSPTVSNVGFDSSASNGQPNQQNQQNYQGQQNQQDQSNQMGQIGSHGITSTDIIWIDGEQEVENYPIAPNCNGMFMDINKMKLYTKDGNTGLIRDFDLNESSESIQRYQQMKQIEHAQFPIVDAYATEVDTVAQKEEIMTEVENKMNERFSALENKLSELTESINNDSGANSNINTNKRGKSMAKK